VKSSIDFSTWLSSWKGTPYRTQFRERGRGVDCVNFVAAYADWLHETTTHVLQLPKLMGFNDHKKTLQVIRILESTWPGTTKVDADDGILAGDVIATKNGDHPVHLMLAGPAKSVLWHASNRRNIPGLKNTSNGVVEESLGTALTMGISRVWRFEEASKIRSECSHASS